MFLKHCLAEEEGIHSFVHPSIQSVSSDNIAWPELSAISESTRSLAVHGIENKLTIDQNVLGLNKTHKQTRTEH